MQDLFSKDDIISISSCASEYKLYPWIDKEKLEWKSILKNPNAIHFIEENVQSYVQRYMQLEKCPEGRVDFYNLYFNPNAIHIIEEKLKIDRLNVNFPSLCENPNAIYLVDEKKKIDPNSVWCWMNIFSNPNAVHIIEEKLRTDPDCLERCDYLLNPLSGNPNTIYLIEPMLDKVDWDMVCLNPNAMHLIEQRIKEGKYVDWKRICVNPNAVHLIQEKYKQDPNSIDFFFLCINPNPEVSNIIDENIYRSGNWKYIFSSSNIKQVKRMYKIYFNYLPWNVLSENPSIFELEKKNELVFEILNELK
jgi:hypothetical protein